MTEQPKLGNGRALAIAGLKAAALLLFLGGTTWAVVYYHDYLWQIVTHRNELRQWILSWGAWGPVVYVGVQVIQVMIFVIPGEVVQGVGGYLFGPWLGALCCLVGALIGSALAFLIAGWLGRPLVKLLVRPEQFERFEKILNGRKGLVTVFVLFLIPGTPKDTLCYVAGMTPIHLGTFVLLSTLARVPGIFLSTFLGDTFAERRYHEFVALCAVGLVALILGLIFRKQVEAWMSKRAGRE